MNSTVPHGVIPSDEPNDTERLAMVLHVFEQRDDNMPLAPSERDVLIAFNAKGEYTKSMRVRVIDSAIRAARTAGVPDAGKTVDGPVTDALLNHAYGPAKCEDCQHEWIAVWPLGVGPLECPKCRSTNTERTQQC